jgi:hypothetical protein
LHHTCCNHYISNNSLRAAQTRESRPPAAAGPPENHRHSGIGLYTPGSVHDGTWKYVRDGRQVVLDAAYLAHPERFHRGPPRAPELPAKVWINQTPSKIESEVK